MADVKISALPAATTPLAGTEVLPIVQSSTTKQVSIANVTAGRAISASSLTLTTQLSVANGGTGLTSLTAGYIPYGNGTGAFSSTTNLSYSDGLLKLGTTGDVTSSGTTYIQFYDTNGQAAYFGYGGDGSGVMALWNRKNGAFLFATNNTEKMRLDSAGNLGLGVTPSAWGSSYKALQFGGGSIAGYQTNTLDMYSNAYDSGAGAWKRVNAGYATRFTMNDSAFYFFTAGTSTAGSTISFTQAMTLDASGNLGIGQTSPAGKLDATTTYGSFILAPTTQIASEIIQVTGNSTSGSSETSILIQQPGNTLGARAKLVSGVISGGSPYFAIGTRSSDGTIPERMRIDSAGNVVINTAAIATNATDGFLYVPTCAGTPTGTPTTYTGRAPIVVNTTNNKLYFYSGGAWRDAGP